MSKIVLKKVKLVGNWPPNSPIDIRFLNKKIGNPPLIVNQTSVWVNYPPNTNFNLSTPGNLWQYWNNAFFCMCHQPLDIDPTQTNAEAVIMTPFGDTHIKYDIVP
ncbi:MAG: hypothetical protein AAGA46_12935 [Cyanobacteria bacterium P01_F01_bin.13]